MHIQRKGIGMSQAKINGVCHWHINSLTFLVEMDPFGYMVAKDTRKFKIESDRALGTSRKSIIS